MYYTFMYKRFKLKGEDTSRMQIVCVEIPGIHTEQLDPDPLKVMQDAYDMLNLFIPVALLNQEEVPLPSSKKIGREYFRVEVTSSNEQKLLSAH